MSNEPSRSTPKPATPKEKHWREVLSQWTASGLSGREFCKREGIEESSFFHWKRELRLRDQRRRGDAVKFVSLQLPKSIGFFDVTVLGGRSVRVPADFDPVALTRLLAVLEGRAC
jgi:hypothetical protein